MTEHVLVNNCVDESNEGVCVKGVYDLLFIIKKLRND